MSHITIHFCPEPLAQLPYGLQVIYKAGTSL
jgi:hypothetical protein